MKMISIVFTLLTILSIGEILTTEYHCTCIPFYFSVRCCFIRSGWRTREERQQDRDRGPIQGKVSVICGYVLSLLDAFIAL